MPQTALEHLSSRRTAKSSRARLTAEHVKLLECTRDGTPPWECLSDVVSLIACLDELVAQNYLAVHGRSYVMTPQGRQFLASVALRDGRASG